MQVQKAEELLFRLRAFLFIAEELQIFRYFIVTVTEYVIVRSDTFGYGS